jgi:3-oxoadipate enol-lactonase
MPMTLRGEVDIHYEVAGDGRETLVLINGVGDDLAAWAPQMNDFIDAGLQVVTFDNRGVGGSGHPPGPYTSAVMAQDVAAVVDALVLPSFHLAGVSMGGVIAQQYAAMHPDRLRSVILANTYAVADAFTRAAFETWALVADSAGMAVMMRQMGPWIFSPAMYENEPARVAELITGAEQTTQPSASFAAQMAALVTHDSTAMAAELRVPALVIAASDDIIIRPALSRRLHDLLPHATWAEVPGGHAAFWEKPEPWNAAILDFIREHSAGAVTSTQRER